MSITDFAWVKKLTFDDFVGQPYFGDFPVLLYIQGNVPLDLDYIDWSHFQEAGGADFRVFDVDGISPLDYEIERWDDVGKEAWIWTKVPLAIRDGVDYLWAAYGKSGAVDTQNPIGVWDDYFRMVQHLQGANWAEIIDSTKFNCDANADDGLPTYQQVGQIFQAVLFDGSDDWIRVPDTWALNPVSGVWTVEFWANPPNVNQQSCIAAKKYPPPCLHCPGWVVGFAADSYWDNPGQRLAMLMREYSGKERGAISDLDVCDGSLHYFVVVWEGILADSVSMYMDGDPLALTEDHKAGSYPMDVVNSDPLYLAYREGIGHYFSGLEDELRISVGARPSNWVKAQYDSMKLTFGTWGPEIEGSDPVVDPYSISDTQLELLRTFPQRSKFYLGVAKGEILYQAQLTGVVDNSPPTGALRLSYANNPDWKQVRNCDEIWVGTTSGTYDIGVVAPVGGTASATQVDIWPTSAPIVVGHWITVRRVNRLWTFPWTLSSCGPSYDFNPVACMGPARLGFVNEALSFDASNSWARNGKTLVDDGSTSPRWNWGVDPASWEYGFIKTHSWTEPGEYWVELYILDSAGKSHTIYRPILIFNRPGTSKPIGQVEDLLTPYTHFELGNFGTTWGAGQEGAGYPAFGGGGVDISILENCSINDFSSWMQIVVVAEDWYGENKAAWGAAEVSGMGGLEYAQEVLYTGWLTESGVRQDAVTGEVSFNVDNIESIMSRLEYSLGFSFVDAGEVGVHDYHPLSAEKIFLHMAEHHSTLKDIVDIYKPLSLLDPEGSEAEGWGPHFSYMDLSGSLGRMLAFQLGGSLGCGLVSTRYGTLHFQPNAQFLVSYTPIAIMDFSKRDWWGDISFRERIEAEVAQVVGNVLNYDIEEMEVKYPTLTETFGIIESVRGLIFVDADAASMWLARYLGWKNLRFQSVSFGVANNRFLEPALQPVVTVTLAIGDTLRQVTWAAKQFIVRAVSYDVDNRGWISGSMSLEEKR